VQTEGYVLESSGKRNDKSATNPQGKEVENMRISLKYGVVLAVFMVSACTLAGASFARTLAAPTITAFTPHHGPVATKVTITGANFTGAQVEFAGRQATDVVVDPSGTKLVVTVPSYVPDGWSGRIAVVTSEGTAMTPLNFTARAAVPVTSPKPVIKSFAPLQAKPGAKVKIRGTNLGGTMWVKIGGVKATFTVPLRTLIVATVPQKATSGKISLKTSDGIATKGLRFTVLRG
jgi:hypothetical protein